MTAATRPPCLHIPHQISFAIWAGYKELAMTLAARITGINVKFMTENGISLK